MKSLHQLLIISITTITFSCEKAKPSFSKVSNTYADTLKIAYNSPRNVQLTPKAATNSNSWKFKKAAEKTIDLFKNGTILEIKASLLEQREAYKEAKKNRSSHNTPAIKARILATHTQSEILLNNLTQNPTDSLRILENIAKVHDSYQHLKLQINEYFAPKIDDFLDQANTINDIENKKTNGSSYAIKKSNKLPISLKKKTPKLKRKLTQPLTKRKITTNNPSKQ